MPKKNDREIRVFPVPHDKPDLERLARAIVGLALKQLSERGQVEADAPAASESTRSDGAAA